MNFIRLLFVVVAGLFSLLGVSNGAMAQDFPSRPVRIIVPYPAAGGVDILARALADALATAWKQSVVVDNRSGGGTIIGAEFVARSAPDGTTLLFTTDSTITGNPHTHAKLPHDPLKDFAPVTLLIIAPQVVVVHPSVQANSLTELIALAKRSNVNLNYASYGNGSQGHLLFEALKAKTGMPLAHIPYRGAAPGLQAVVAGEVQVSLVPLALSRALVQSGKLRPLAIGRPERSPELPNVPTLKELGLGDTYPLTWFGLFAPAATPPDIVQRINTDVTRILSAPDFRERHINQRGYDLAVGTIAEFVEFIRNDYAEKASFVRRAGLKPE